MITYSTFNKFHSRVKTESHQSVLLNQWSLRVSAYAFRYAPSTERKPGKEGLRLGLGLEIRIRFRIRVRD